MEHNKQDLTLHSDNELSLVVFNDEGLYNQRNKPRLKNILEHYFMFTESQYEVLLQDILEDQNSL